jgi:[ribosomal protein S18]-alanine N-acetyltransferase
MNAILKPLEFDFRPMASTDLENLVRIERAAYPYPWTLGNFQDCLESGYSSWVAEIDGRLAGYWIMMIAVGEGHILNCCVAPAWQGRGFGRQLVEHLMQVARAHGTQSLFLEVRPSNAAAVGLYQRLGFETIGVRRGYYPADQGQEDALVMRLDL